MSDTKQVILMRSDLGMSAGKVAAQACHASLAFLTSRLSVGVHTGNGSEHKLRLVEAERDWIRHSFAKVVLEVWSEDHLMSILRDAERHGLVTHLISDEGRTVFKGVRTVTCAAIGPDTVEKINAVTGHLKLFKQSR